MWDKLPNGAFCVSVFSNGQKMFVGVKNGNNGSAIYLNYSGARGRVINDNGTFSELSI